MAVPDDENVRVYQDGQYAHHVVDLCGEEEEEEEKEEEKDKKEEEEEKKEEGRAAKLSLIHDLERGLSSTEQTAAVRSYFASVHALPSNGQHLSALAKSASIDQQVQWLKSLRS